jgi:nucleoside-diphosphate-sugar epimerase
VNKKLLITGGSGFIGRNLCKKLLETQEFDFISPDSKEIDITKKETFALLFADEIFHVIHLAGKVFVPDSWINPDDFITVNAFGTKNMLEFCRRYNISLTYISTYLYGQPEHIPIDEEAPVKVNNPYAFSKHLAEQLCSFYAQEYGVKIIILRLFNIYGPGQKEKLLIPHIIKQCISDKEIIVEDILPKRDYVYVDDFINLLLSSIKQVDSINSNYEIFNVGSGYSMSVAEIIDTVQNILGTTKNVVSKKNKRKNEINDVVADISKIRKYFKWEPKYTFEQGIAETIDYYGTKLI